MSTSEQPVRTAPQTYEIVPGQSVTEAIIYAVADVADCPSVAGVGPSKQNDGSEIEPLYNVVDPDALESLVSPTQMPREGGVKISFRYHTYQITVYDYGIIHIKPSEEDK